MALAFINKLATPKTSVVIPGTNALPPRTVIGAAHSLGEPGHVHPPVRAALVAARTNKFIGPPKPKPKPTPQKSKPTPKPTTTSKAAATPVAPAAPTSVSGAIAAVTNPGAGTGSWYNQVIAAQNKQTDAQAQTIRDIYNQNYQKMVDLSNQAGVNFADLAKASGMSFAPGSAMPGQPDISNIMNATNAQISAANATIPLQSITSGAQELLKNEPFALQSLYGANAAAQEKLFQSYSSELMKEAAAGNTAALKALTAIQTNQNTVAGANYRAQIAGNVKLATSGGSSGTTTTGTAADVKAANAALDTEFNKTIKVPANDGTGTTKDVNFSTISPVDFGNYGAPTNAPTKAFLLYQSISSLNLSPAQIISALQKKGLTPIELSSLQNYLVSSGADSGFSSINIKITPSQIKNYFQALSTIPQVNTQQQLNNFINSSFSPSVQKQFNNWAHQNQKLFHSFNTNWQG